MNPPSFPLTRRHFLDRLTFGLGGIALSDLLRGTGTAQAAGLPGLPTLPHYAAKAKRVIFLYMSGGMTQFETFDHKPELVTRMGG